LGLPLFSFAILHAFVQIIEVTVPAAGSVIIKKLFFSVLCLLLSVALELP